MALAATASADAARVGAAVDDDRPGVGREQAASTSPRSAAQLSVAAGQEPEPSARATSSRRARPAAPRAGGQPVGEPGVSGSASPSAAGASPARSTSSAPPAGAAEQQRERGGDDGGARAAFRRPARDEHRSLPMGAARRGRGGKHRGKRSGAMRCLGRRRPRVGDRRHRDKGSNRPRDAPATLGRGRPADRGSDRVAAFFDLDKTVIAKASMVAFGRPLLRAGITRWLLLRAVWSQLIFHISAPRREACASSASRRCASPGWDQAEISTIVRDTLIEVIEPIVYDEALELIREHQRRATRLHHLGVTRGDRRSARSAPRGRRGDRHPGRARRRGSLHREIDFYAYGPYKAEAIHEVAELEGIDLERSYAYSDSVTDLPMLEVVGHPVAVNPDRDLARVAEDREWRSASSASRAAADRVPMPPPAWPRGWPPAASVVVLGAGGGAAMVGGRRRRHRAPRLRHGVQRAHSAVRSVLELLTANAARAARRGARGASSWPAA